MPHPEGYRKALRLMKLAEKFRVPVITFIDRWVRGGLGGKGTGSRRRLARNLFGMSRLQGSDHRHGHRRRRLGWHSRTRRRGPDEMLENAVYSVITVEGCAAILWKDGKSQEMREKAASALRITAQDLLELRVIDEIIPEPPGGAHANHEATAQSVKETLVRQMEDLRRYKPDKLVRRRRDKFLRMGQFLE